MLAGHEAVVGGEDQQGVAELAGLAEGVHDPGDALVDGEQRREPLPVDLGQRRDLPLPEPRPALDARRLVGDVGLVERRRARQRNAEERRAVSGGGHRRVEGARVEEVARAAGVGGDVVGPQEERRVGGAAPDEGQRSLGDFVGLEAGRGLEPAVLVQRVAGEAVRRAAEQPVEVGPAGRDEQRVAAAVAVEVLADHAGRVAGAPKPDGERLGAVQLPEAAERRRGSTARRGCARTGR